MYPWLVFLHVLGAFAFVMAHGASANVVFRLRHETSRERIAALLDLSTTYLNAMYAGLTVLILAGIAAGFAGDWWGRGWIWLSLGILLAIAIAMYGMGTQTFGRLRKAAGLPYFANMRPQPPVPPASDAEITARARAQSRADHAGRLRRADAHSVAHDVQAVLINGSDNDLMHRRYRTARKGGASVS